MFFSKPAGHRLVDIGDIADAQFDAEDFTIDGNWHTLDISSVVPAGVDLVRVNLDLTAVGIGDNIAVKNDDYTGAYNRIVACGYVAGYSAYKRGLISCSSDRKIKYKITAGVAVVFLNVVGWVLK